MGAHAGPLLLLCSHLLLLSGCAGSLSHQCQHHLLMGNGAEPPALAQGHLATCPGLPVLCPSALGLLLACRKPSGQGSGRTSLGPGRTLQRAPPRPVCLSLLLRPSKHSLGAESERKGAESPGLMTFIPRCLGQPSVRAGCCAAGIWSHQTPVFISSCVVHCPSG